METEARVGEWRATTAGQAKNPDDDEVEREDVGGDMDGTARRHLRRV
jgi:hypothetical protein